MRKWSQRLRVSKRSTKFALERSVLHHSCVTLTRLCTTAMLANQTLDRGWEMTVGSGGRLSIHWPERVSKVYVSNTQMSITQAVSVWSNRQCGGTNSCSFTSLMASVHGFVTAWGMIAVVFHTHWEYLLNSALRSPRDYFAVGRVNDDNRIPYSQQLASGIRRQQVYLSRAQSRSSYVPAEPWM